MGKLSDVKSRRLLWDFMDYCLANPTEKFWEALRNWSKYEFIYGSNKAIVMEEVDNLEDTFYKEGK